MTPTYHLWSPTGDKPWYLYRGKFAAVLHHAFHLGLTDEGREDHTLATSPMQGHVQTLNQDHSPLSSACCFLSLLCSSSNTSYVFFAAAFSSCNFTKAEPSLQASYEGE